jgi:hypothetical protein
MVPELWDPMTGKTKQIVTYKEEDGQTIIPLSFEPEGSRFIIFRKAVASPHIIKIEKDGKSFFPNNDFAGTEKPCIQIFGEEGKMSTTIFEPGNYSLTWNDGSISQVNLTTPNARLPLSGKWKINFDTSWGGPAQIEVDSLKSWTEFDDPGIKYYSGKATYKKTFSILPGYLTGKKAILDLGNVLEMSSIKINGIQLPVKWSAPFQFDVTNYIKPGNNELEVQVVNLWPNRLIGDGKLPLNKRFTKTNIVKFDDNDAEKLLRKSGLLGPVEIMFIHNEINTNFK